MSDQTPLRQCDACDICDAGPDLLIEPDCPRSQRACGHHCDHEDTCCWCGGMWVDTVHGAKFVPGEAADE